MSPISFFYVIAQFFLVTDFETYLLIFDPKCSLVKFENWWNSNLISISFAIESILSDPPFLKSRVTLLHRNVSARQSPTFPTIKPIKFVPSEYGDVDRKKDQKRPYQNHPPKNSLAGVKITHITHNSSQWPTTRVEQCY